MTLPPSFEARMRKQLGVEYPDFEAALQTPAPVSIRLNRMKPRPALAALCEAVPWHPLGGYLPERPVFALDPQWHGGAYYVQEASSMLLAECVRQLPSASGPLRVLDLCGAPGGKTTLLADALPEGSLVVSNEVIRQRSEVLAENVVKWGNPNVVVTQADPSAFAPLKGWFDAILVDAPCSGEGLFRKDPDATKEWSEEAVMTCAARQRRILADVVPLLREGGMLWYSTCTYNASENDENVSWLTRELGLERAPMSLSASWGITETDFGYQCYPHKVRGEGFYMAPLRKVAPTLTEKHPEGFLRWSFVGGGKREQLNEWLQMPKDMAVYERPDGVFVALPQRWMEAFGVLQKVVRPKVMGVELGELKGKDVIPAHALALSTARSEAVAGCELSTQEALTFLRKETLDKELPRGWHLMKHEGIALGWAKAIPGRINNYLPKHFRLRMS